MEVFRMSVLIVAAAVMLLAGGVRGQDSLNVAKVSEIAAWGDIKSIDVSGDYVYACDQNSGLKIIDISNPENPFITAFTNYEHEAVIPLFRPKDLVFIEDYIYLAGKGIKIMDVTDKYNPVEVSFLEDPVNYYTAIAVNENYAYVIGGSGSDGLLKIFNINDVQNPTEIGSCTLPLYGFTLKQIAVEEGYAYIAAHSSGLLVVDISDPQYPEIIGQLDLGYPITDVAVFEQVVFTTYGNLSIIDVTDPWQPVLHSVFESEDSFHSLEIDGDIMYCGVSWMDPPWEAYYGLLLLDISDPLIPVEEGACWANHGWGTYYDIGILDDRVYTAAGEQGIWIFDVSELQNPACIAQSSGLVYINYVEIAGETAYIIGDEADGGHGLSIYNVTCIESPVELGYETGLSATVYDFDYYQDHVYTSENAAGLSIIDVTDSMNPQLIETLSFPLVYVRETEIRDSIAYVACWGGLYLVDISNPDQPAILSDLLCPDSTYSIALKDNYVFLANYSAGLFIIDVSDAQNPAQVSCFSEIDNLRAIRIENDIAYVLKWDYYGNEVYCLDVSNPINPIITGEFSINGYKIEVEGNYLYTTKGYDGFSIYDLTDPANVCETGFYNTLGYCSDLAIIDEIILVSDGYSVGFYDCSEALSLEHLSDSKLSTSFSLSPIYPNPFNNSMTVEYQVARAGDIRLTVYDVLGRKVGVIQDGYVIPGNYSCQWNAENIASGIYYIQLEQGGMKEVRKAVLVK